MEKAKKDLVEGLELSDEEIEKVAGGASTDVNTYTITLADMTLSKAQWKRGEYCAVFDWDNKRPR